MFKATSVDQKIGTDYGQRGILFIFATKGGSAQIRYDLRSVVRLNGQPYNMIEAHALRDIIACGVEVLAYTHRLLDEESWQAATAGL